MTDTLYYALVVLGCFIGAAIFYVVSFEAPDQVRKARKEGDDVHRSK